jgi:hypothetical protein
MADINGCIKKLNLSADDAEEIRRMARVAGDPAAGVKQYKDTLKTDLESLRTSLSDKGYDFSVRKPTEELGAKSTPEASMTDLGYDVQNIANVTTENVNLARALADTVPGLSAGKDLFKWMGTNSERLLNFKAKYFKFADEKEFEINARVAQETFPELFDAARRGVVSDAQTAKEAKALGKGLTPEQGVQTVLNTPAGYAPNAAEVQFGKMVMGSVHDDLRRIAKIDVSKMSDAESDEISRQYSEALDTWVAVTAKVGGMTSEQGRAFRSLQIAPNDISKVAQKSIKFVDAITGNSRTAEERKALLHDLGKAISMLDPENQQQLDLFVANLHQNKSDLSSKFYEVYYNWGLLSNPSTQFINTLGNTANFILENTERLAAAATMPSEMKPTLFRMAGYGNSLWDAVKVGWRAYKTELPSDPQTVLENMDKRAFPSFRITKDGIKSAGVGEEGIVLGGKQVRIPGRILLGVDDGMKLLHNRAYIYEQMYRRADAQNLTGEARKEFYKNFLKETPSDVLEGAVEEARRLTYTDKLGQGLRGFQQFVDAVPGGRIVIPFVRTPAKIIKQAADMLSVPFISEKLSTQRTADDFAAGGFAQRKAMARVTMGYSLMGLGAYMAANGLATGPAPSDAGERETFNLNKLAWGAKVGNNWIQYNRFDPVAIPITFGVGLEKTFEAFAQSGTGLAREEGYLSTMAAFMSDALLDKSFFQGVENVVGAIMEPERRFESFTKGVVRSFTPAITAGFARSVDPRTTAPLTFMEVIQDRIGFEQRKKVPTKVDAFGRDVWNEVPGSYKGDTGIGSVTNRFINPFKAKSGANDPVANELFDLGIKVTPTRKKYKDVDLDSEQVYVLNKAAGKMFYDFTRNAMAQPEWKSKSNVVKRLTIEAFKDASNKYGQAMLLGVYPELASRGALENKDIKKLTAPTRSDTMEYLKPNSKR